MTTDILLYTFYGNPVPALRARAGRRNVYNPKKYTEYKGLLAEALHAEFEDIAFNFPEAGSKDRSKHLKNIRYELWIVARTIKDVGDGDNFLKMAADALQQAGIIANDKQIKRGHYDLDVDKENPRIEIELHKYHRGHPSA